MPTNSSENQVLLAINAIQSTLKLSIRRAVEIYEVPVSTIRHRIKGKPTKANSHNARSNLIVAEEDAILNYIKERED